jgi:hypothetical protein
VINKVFDMERRNFIKKNITGLAGIAVLPEFYHSRSNFFPDDQKQMLIGTPVLPVYLYEKGIPEALREMQEIAAINTVMTFSHTFQFRQYRKDFTPLTNGDGKEITDVFVKTNPDYYQRKEWQGKIPDAKYADRDILDELSEAAKPLGMKVYSRILEPYVITGAIPGFEDFAEINTDGETSKNVCFNHPGYIGYWHSVIEDLIRSHPHLNGFKFGQERGGPIMGSLGGEKATCFCKHCIALAKSRGINTGGAREGMKALQQFGIGVMKNGEVPRDGFFVSFFRIISQYPDLLSWEKLWMDSREEQRKRMYKQIKAINPLVEVGWHIDHGMTWDLITRTFNDYSTMGPYSDWLSIAVYFDSIGRRSRNHYEKFYQKLLFGDASPQYSYPMYLSMLGLDPEKEPALEEHQKKDTPFSSEYVYNECLRAVKTVNKTAKIYARPGFDMPGYNCNISYQQVYDAVTRALDAGVDGLWCGREWNEIKPENAKAFGDAVRNYKR